MLLNFFDLIDSLHAQKVLNSFSACIQGSLTIDLNFGFILLLYILHPSPITHTSCASPSEHTIPSHVLQLLILFPLRSYFYFSFLIQMPSLIPQTSRIYFNLHSSFHFSIYSFIHSQMKMIGKGE